MGARHAGCKLFGVVICIVTGTSRGSMYFGGRDEVALEVRTALGPGGLFNQHCKLLDFLTLASVLKPDKVVLTSATKREAFAAVQTWSEVPLGSLWDEESIAAFLADHDIEYVRLDNSREHTCNLKELPTLFRRGLPPSDVIRLWKRHIADAVSPEMLTSGKCKTIVEPVEDVFLASETKHSHRYAEAASRVKFNRTISMLADQLVSAIQQRSGDTAGRFSGVHLRIEEDASAWFVGDAYNDRPNLLRHFKEVVYNFDADNTVFIAGAFNETIEADIGSFFERRVVTKRKLLGEAQLSGLHSEQLALLDFLVLAKAQYFVGFVASSMSYFCQEYRLLLGKPRLTSYLIDMQRDWYDFKEVLAVGTES